MISNSKEETETKTFRVKSSVLDQLKREAEEEGISLNSLVHKAFMQYIWCNTKTAKGMMVPVSKARLRVIMEKMTEEEIIEVSQANSKTDPKALQFILHGEYSEDALIESLEIWSIASRFTFSKKRTQDNKIQLLVHHNMGYKCSLFFCKTIAEAIHNATGNRPQYNISDNFFALTVVDS
ncbi:hypothetical protein NTE_00147 [Candidatus Nitrososphaera evergladensis SR1]|uniref:Uncharacterized protein n=1 Tax=Candidatus Nitrososphaera evergladensis SR1 TaxID=1459636 RepID=A0A075MSA2_9ARCH|nr:hypothetical protein [Candidatus Nitrososphaera evergladensis]AIF82229.1 hypothetical protein NTE_00147 [Candidatus Nitrososphaera evergladensis SR1]